MTQYHSCPGCGRPIKTGQPKAKSGAKRTRLCGSCRIGQHELPAPNIQIVSPHYLRWLKTMAAHVREVSR